MFHKDVLRYGYKDQFKNQRFFPLTSLGFKFFIVMEGGPHSTRVLVNVFKNYFFIFNYSIFCNGLWFATNYRYVPFGAIFLAGSRQTIISVFST